MSNSRTLVPFVLVYDNMQDVAHWLILSVANRLRYGTNRWEIIQVGAENYEVIAKLAGPKPVVLAEEYPLIDTTRKDNVEKDSDSNNALNPHDVTTRK